jgi:hypothetical protein
VPCRIPERSNNQSHALPICLKHDIVNFVHFPLYLLVGSLVLSVEQSNNAQTTCFFMTTLVLAPALAPMVVSDSQITDTVVPEHFPFPTAESEAPSRRHQS